MRDFHIGDRVTFLDRTYYVRGITPISIAPRRVKLESVKTGNEIEIAVDQLARALPSAQSSDRSTQRD